MDGRRWVMLGMLALGAIGGVLWWQRCAPERNNVVDINVDLGISHQTLEGFGASAAWWAQAVGGWEDTRESIADLLFDREQGIGLTILRYNLGGGEGWNIQDPWRRAETYEVAPGVYDWSRDANARWLLHAAHARGVQQIVAFVNSPPARMTVSGLTTGEKDGGSNLRPEMVGAFVRYLLDVVRYLQEQEGLPITHISPVNEPQWNWSYKNGQEGCHYSPAEAATVTRALLDAIDTEGLMLQVSAPESGEWKHSTVYADALLSDPHSASRLPHFAVHSYWSERADKERLVRYLDQHYPGTALWMSEWTEMREGRDTGMDSALVLANTVQEDLIVGGVTSWQYWIAVSKYHFRDGLIYVEEYDHKVVVAKRLWALGNFSRFVRPGYTRIAAATPERALHVSAFRAPAGDEVVVVAVNNGAAALEVRLALAEHFSQAQAYETSAGRDLEQVYAGKTPHTFTLTGQSVTTLILRR